MRTFLKAPAQQTASRCRIAACAHLRTSADTIGQLRKQPIELGAEKLPTSFLKHADDQTVLALSAVLAAVRKDDWQNRSFANWGVLAAPHWFGRVGIAKAVERFRVEGAWGISPHLIPHLSLHAIPGTISQALKIHGPNFGIGGGPNPGPDAFLIAAAMLADGALPGLWLVLTGYETEWIPAATRAVPAPICHAVALALTPFESKATGLSLSIALALPDDSALAFYPEFELTSFAEEPSNFAGKWRLADSHWLEIEAEA